MLQAFALFRQEDVLQKAIHAMKYHAQRDMAPLLIRQAPLHLPRDAVLVPVPLSKERLLGRGYNQAELLAEVYASCTEMKIERLLERTRHTQAQAKLSRSERLRNVHQAFRALRAVPPKIVLVDDVATTLATLESCAVALRLGGARWVGALVLARAPAPG